MPEFSPLPPSPPETVESDAAAQASQKAALAPHPPIIPSLAYPAATQTEFYRRAQALRPDLTTRELAGVWALRGGEEGLAGAIDYMVRARTNPYLISGSAALRGEQPTGLEPREDLPPPAPKPLTEQQALQVKLGPTTVKSAIDQFAPYKNKDGTYDLARALKEDPEKAGAARIAGFPESAIRSGAAAAIASQYQAPAASAKSASAYLEQYKVTSGPDVGKYNLVKLAQDDPEHGLGLARASGLFTPETLSQVAVTAQKATQAAKMDSGVTQQAQGVVNRVPSLSVANVSDSVAAKAQQEIEDAGGLLDYFRVAIAQGKEADIGKAKTALYADPDIVNVHSAAVALESLNGYRNADGSYRLAEAIADGRSPDTLAMAGWSPKVVADSQRAAQSLLDRDAVLRDLRPYANAGGTYNLAQAVADGFDRPTLGKVFADVDIDQAVAGSIGTPTTARAAEIASGVPSDAELQATGFAQPKQAVIPSYDEAQAPSFASVTAAQVEAAVTGRPAPGALYDPYLKAQYEKGGTPVPDDPALSAVKDFLLDVAPVTGTVRGAKRLSVNWESLPLNEKIYQSALVGLSAVGDVAIVAGGAGLLIKGARGGAVAVVTTTSGKEAAQIAKPLTIVADDTPKYLQSEVLPALKSRTPKSNVDIIIPQTAYGMQAAAAIDDLARAQGLTTRGILEIDHALTAAEARALAGAAREAGVTSLQINVIDRPFAASASKDVAQAVSDAYAKWGVKIPPEDIAKRLALSGDKKSIAASGKAVQSALNEVGIRSRVDVIKLPPTKLRPDAKLTISGVRLEPQGPMTGGGVATRLGPVMLVGPSTSRPISPVLSAAGIMAERGYAVRTGEAPVTEARAYVGPKPIVVTAAPAAAALPSLGAMAVPSPSITPSYAPAYAPSVRPVTAPEVVTAPRIAPRPGTEPAPAVAPAPAPTTIPAPAYAPVEAPMQAPSVSPEAVPSVRVEAAPTVAVAPAPSAGVAPGASPFPGPGPSPAPAPAPTPAPATKGAVATKTATTAQRTPLIPPFRRPDMQFAETARDSQGPTYSFRQDFLVVRIPPPYSASGVDYAETPTPGDVMVNGPKQAFQLIKRRIGMVPKDLLREFANLAKAPRE